MFKSFSFYSIALIIDKGIGFLLLPMFTFYLTKSDFGSLSLLNTLYSFTLPIITLGVQTSLSYHYFNTDRINYPVYFSSAIIPSVLLTAVLTSLTLFGMGYFELYLKISSIWIIIIPIFAFLSFFNSMLLVDCQIKNEPITYIIFSLGNSILTLLISAIFVMKLNLGFEGRLYGQYGTILIIFSFSFFMLKYKKKLIVSHINWKHCRDSLSFGLPLLPHTLGFMVINMADRFFINDILGKEILGIYNIGYLIGSSISILSTAFATSVVPFSFELFAQNTLESLIKVVKVYWIFIFAILFLYILLLLFTPFIFNNFIDQKFASAQIFVKWIGLGFVFQGLYLLFGNVIFFLKKTQLFFYCSFVNVSINLTLNYFLVNKYGVLGAAYSFLISSLLFFLIIAYLSNKLLPLPWLTFFKRTRY